MLHNTVSEEDNGIDVSLEAAKFGLDLEQDIASKLKAQVKEATTEGFPTNKKNRLLQLLMKHKSVSRKNLKTTFQRALH